MEIAIGEFTDLILTIVLILVSIYGGIRQIHYRTIIGIFRGRLSIGLKISTGMSRDAHMETCLEYRPISPPDADGVATVHDWKTIESESDLSISIGGFITFEIGKIEFKKSTEDKIGWTDRHLASQKFEIEYDDRVSIGKGERAIFHMKISIDGAKKWDVLLYYDNRHVFFYKTNHFSPSRTLDRI